MRVTVSENELVFILKGWQKVWAMRSRLRVPRSAIEHIDYTSQAPTAKSFWGFWRLPGTAVPGIFLAGSYIKRGERDFWYVHVRRLGLLTVALKNGLYKYDVLRISMDPKTAATVLGWWGNRA